MNPTFLEPEENYLPVNMNETSQSSPLLTYKIDRYRQYYHPLEPSPLLKPQLAIDSPLMKLSPLGFQSFQTESTLLNDYPLQINSSSVLFHPQPLKLDFHDIKIREAILSPSPRSKKRSFLTPVESGKKKKNCKRVKSCFWGFFGAKGEKELKNWWIESPEFSIIANTFHSFKHVTMGDDSHPTKYLNLFKKFPQILDLSLNLDTFAELGENNTFLLRNILSQKKLQKVLDLRVVSFPGEKTLWHGPAFLFNAIMGFNMNEDTDNSSNSRIEIWHRFRSYFDRGAYQEEIIDILNTLNARLKEEKLETLHFILSSNLRFNDRLLLIVQETLELCLQGLSELKLFFSGRNITDYGLESLCERIVSLSPHHLRSFHLFLDYRSPNITSKGILKVCRTLLKLAETNIIEYLSLGFISNHTITDDDLVLIGDALRLVSKSLRSIVLIVSGNMTDFGLIKMLEGVIDAPNLRKVCLGFMGNGLSGSKKLMSWVGEIMNKKAAAERLYLLHWYYNNSKGGRNETLEGEIRERLSMFKDVEVETYVFC